MISIVIYARDHDVPFLGHDQVLDDAARTHARTHTHTQAGTYGGKGIRDGSTRRSIAPHDAAGARTLAAMAFAVSTGPACKSGY